MSGNKKFFESPSGQLLSLYEQEKLLNPILQSRHSLDDTLVVSITSYKPRFKWLHLTLKSLLEQTILPDEIVLWIAESDMNDLPESVLTLSDKIKILPTEDLRSYKKIIPALARYVDTHIAICDDDIYYPRNWLGDLVQGVKENQRAIIACMAHRYHYLSTGRIARYAEWSFDVQDHRARSRCVDIVPVGVGGVLYPPNSLHSDVSNVSLFSKLCPTSDDLWLYVMARLNGYLPVKVGEKLRPILWPDTQDVGLYKENFLVNDDIAISNLMTHYGNEIFNNEQR